MLSSLFSPSILVPLKNIQHDYGDEYAGKTLKLYLKDIKLNFFAI